MARISAPSSTVCYSFDLASLGSLAILAQYYLSYVHPLTHVLIPHAPLYAITGGDSSRYPKRDMKGKRTLRQADDGLFVDNEVERQNRAEENRAKAKQAELAKARRRKTPRIPLNRVSDRITLLSAAITGTVSQEMRPVSRTRFSRPYLKKFMIPCPTKFVPCMFWTLSSLSRGKNTLVRQSLSPNSWGCTS